jgi:hypothetical protein
MEIFASNIDDSDNSTSILSTGDMFGGGTVTEVTALNPVYLNNENTGFMRLHTSSCLCINFAKLRQ